MKSFFFSKMFRRTCHLCTQPLIRIQLFRSARHSYVLQSVPSGVMWFVVRIGAKLCSMLTFMLCVMLMMAGFTHLRGKRVQRQPMTNGGINVEIGNPSYNMYEVDHDNHADAGSLLRPNFTLDPHKVWLLYSMLNQLQCQQLTKALQLSKNE